MSVCNGRIFVHWGIACTWPETVGTGSIYRLSACRTFLADSKSSQLEALNFASSGSVPSGSSVEVRASHFEGCKLQPETSENIKQFCVNLKKVTSSGAGESSFWEVRGQKPWATS